MPLRCRPMPPKPPRPLKFHRCTHNTLARMQLITLTKIRLIIIANELINRI